MNDYIKQAEETTKELENLEKQYEDALDAGDDHKAQLIQRRIDMIHKYM